ncbi:MAG: tripartite tricarboxylate transporter substrate binding protein [Alcaligenaceae bacterium]
MIQVYFRILSALIVALILAPVAAWAQTPYPSKPIRIIAPFPPGGAVDIVARTLAQHLSTSLGQPVLVENKPGANGTIGSALVAKAEPDGHTLLLSSVGAITIIPHVRDVGYDPLKSLMPVTQAVRLSLMWLAKPGLEAKTMADLIKLEKAGVKLSAGTSGNGSPNHIAIEQFNLMAGTHIIAVPYRGESPALTDLMGGQIDLAVITLVAAAVPLNAGSIKLLATSGSKAPPTIPQLPTVAESAGLTDYSVEAWQGVFVPAGTAPEIVNRLNAEIVKIVRSPDVSKFLLDRGSEPVGSSVSEFSALVQTEFMKYGTLAKKIQLKVE